MTVAVHVAPLRAEYQFRFSSFLPISQHTRLSRLVVNGQSYSQSCGFQLLFMPFNSVKSEWLAEQSRAELNRYRGRITRLYVSKRKVEAGKETKGWVQ